jgi:hypothetical protein
LSERKGDIKLGLNTTEPLFFYDPQTSFGARIWAVLNADVVHIKIDSGISEIMKKTSSYVRKGMNRESYECLNIFNQMIAAANTRDALSALYVGKSLFSGVHCPTSEMISMLKDSFGSIVSEVEALEKPARKLTKLVRKIKDHANKSILKSNVNGSVFVSDQRISRVKAIVQEPPVSLGISRRNDSAATLDDAFSQTNQIGIKRTPNFVQLYKSQYPLDTVQPRLRNKQSDSVFNYSIQEVSSTNHQLQLLRDDMKHTPSTFYTYGTEYLSQTVPPIDTDEEKKKLEMDEKRLRLTSNGWS